MTIQSYRGPYTVRFESGWGGLEKGLGSSEHLIIDAKAADLFQKELKAALGGISVLRIEATEANKSLEKIPAYVLRLLENGIRRNHTLVAVGGGIVQDITAFIASCLFRGVSWRYVPTTLLAQADSCIGSKSSINVGPYKNQVGTFTPPTEVVVSPDFLQTLSVSDLRSGIGEMIKVHVIAGWEDARRIANDYPALLTNGPVLQRAIRRSLEIKKEKIERDEFDRGERLVMNYGHTFGHAIESATDYRVPHGIAVTIGMDMANFVSWRTGLIDRTVYEELHPLLLANSEGFETEEIPEERFFSALRKDKKNTAQEISLILMKGPGQVFLDRRAEDAEFRSFCRDYFNERKGRVLA